MKQIIYNIHVRGLAGLIEFYFKGDGRAAKDMQPYTRTHGDYLSVERQRELIKHCYKEAREDKSLELVRQWMKARGWDATQYEEIRK